MDKEYLEDCLSKGMSLKQIAAVEGCAPGTVGYYVRKHGLVANGSAKYDPTRRIEREQLEPLLAEGLTLIEIAERLRRSPSAICRRIKSLGLEGTRRSRRTLAVKEARAAGDKELLLDCPLHGLTPFWIGESATRCRKCNSAGVARRRRRVKEILVEEAGGACILCGFNASPAALEFHHLDPAKKSFALSDAGITRSLASAREEAKKCALVCANCHAQVEIGALQLGPERRPGEESP